MSEELHLTGKAQRTHNGYIRAVRQLSDFAECSPDEVTEIQVRKFFLHLKNDRNSAYGTLRVALSGVKFFFTHTCKRDWEVIRMLKLQNINAPPEVLIAELDRVDVKEMMEALGFVLWAINDPRAVPSLIRAIPRRRRSIQIYRTGFHSRIVDKFLYKKNAWWNLRLSVGYCNMQAPESIQGALERITGHDSHGVIKSDVLV